jgi:tetratricopeptide (TPR) repeat protein
MNRNLTIHAALAVTITLSALLATPAQAQTPALRLSTLALTIPQDADTLYNQGVDAQNMGKFPEAIKKYSDAIAKRKTFNDAYLNRGICYLETSDFDKAIADFNFFIERKPTVAVGYINRAQAYTEKKMYDEALKDYATALQNNPRAEDKQLIFLNRAATYYNKGDYDGAIKDYSDYITAAGAKPEPVGFLNRGLAYLNKGRALAEKNDEAGSKTAFASAAKDFDAYVTAKPDDPEGYISRAEANVGAKIFDKAITDLNKYTTMKPNDAIGFALRAQAYLSMDPSKPTEASTDITKALAIDPNNQQFAGLRLQLASAYYKKGDLKGAVDEATKLLSVPGQAKNKLALTIRAQALSDMAAKNASDTASLANAIKDYDVLIMIDANDAISLRNRGVAYYRLNQFDKAIPDFDAYIKLKPNEAEGYNLKGLTLLKMMPPKYDLAIQAYSAYIAKKPDDTIALYNRGLAYYEMKNYEKALPDFEGAAKDPKHPNAKDIPALISTCLINTGKLDVAIKKLTEAIAANPNDGTLYINRGGLYFQTANTLPEGDANRTKGFTDALADFSKAASLMPKDADPLVNRSLTNFKLAKWDDAVKDATAALAIKADSPEALITRADAAYNAATAKKDKAGYTAAIADYKKYLTLPGLKPEQELSATEGLAQACISSGDFAGAIDAYNKLLTKDANNAMALRGRGAAYYNTKQYDPALKDFDAYIAKKADDPIGFNFRGLVYKAKGDLAKAAADFEKAYSLKADFGVANNAGEAYLAQGDALFDPDPDKAYDFFTKAVAMFDKAIAAGASEEKSKVANAYYNKGLALVKQARCGENKTQVVDGVPAYKQAVEAYTKYLEFNPMAADKEQVQTLVGQLKEKAGL